MARFSPSPWSTGTRDACAIFDRNGTFIATTMGDGEEAKPLWVADARLMAAAPAMLAVLKSLEWANEYAQMPGRDPVFECPCCGALNEAGPDHEPDCGLAEVIALAEAQP